MNRIGTIGRKGRVITQCGSLSWEGMTEKEWELFELPYGNFPMGTSLWEFKRTVGSVKLSGGL